MIVDHVGVTQLLKTLLKKYDFKCGQTQVVESDVGMVLYWADYFPYKSPKAEFIRDHSILYCNFDNGYVAGLGAILSKEEFGLIEQAYGPVDTWK